MQPPQPLVHIGDDADPVAEVGQRAAQGMQTAQGVVNTWAIHSQRRDVRERGEIKGPRRQGQGDENQAIGEGRAVAALAESVDSTVRVEALADPPAVLPEQGQSDQVSNELAERTRLGFRVVTTAPQSAAGDEAQIERQLRESLNIELGQRPGGGNGVMDAAYDEAAESGALWAQADDDPKTIPYIGGHNPRAHRSAKLSEAIGDASEQAGEEARKDPLTAGIGDDPLLAGWGDPLAANVWDTQAIDPEQPLDLLR